jgi:hypothetical protein
MEPEKDIFKQWTEERESRSWIRKKIDYISLWWSFDGKYIIKNIREGFKNIWYWSPIVWKDRNWDHQFIFEILSHKLKSHAEYIDKKGIHLNSWQNVRDMNICISLIEKINEGYYSHEFSDYHEIKTWFEPCEDREGFSEWKSKTITENFDDYFAKYPLTYKRVLNGETPFEIVSDDKYKIAISMGMLNHKRAIKLLFKIMGERIETWWD